jgi:putative MATE family efflux protein
VRELKNSKTKWNKLKLVKLFIEALKGKEEDYTIGSIKRAIFLLAIPMIIEMAMESLFAVVDAYFVAQIDKTAVAAVGLTEAVLITVYAVAFGLSMGTTAMVARRIGEKKPREAEKAAAQSINLGLALSVVIGLLGFFFAKDILIMMDASEEVINIGYEYTEIIFASNSSIMLIFLINAVFRGAGNASIAMRTLILSNVINMILDPCLIFGLWIFPELGVKGAAIATTTGRTIGVIYQLTALASRNHTIHLNLRSFLPDFSVIKRLVKLSMGGIGQFVISTFSWTFLIRIVSSFGDDAVAGYTLAFRVIIFTILPSWGLANAAATLVGQNLGANKPDRAEKSVWLSAIYNMIFLALVSVVFITLAEEIIGFFINDPNVIQLGADCLKYISFGYIFFAYGMVMIQAFNGAGDTKTPTILNFCFHWVVQIPLAIFLANQLGMGPRGVYIALPISETLLTIAAIFWFRKGHWKTKNV